MKKATKRKKVEPDEESDSVAFQVRFDRELHASLKKHAESAGISLNQLIQGMCQGLSDYLNHGKAEEMSSGFVKHEDRKGCIYFGRRGRAYTEQERHDHERGLGETLPPDDDGSLWFSLDFTPRGFVHHNQPRW